MKGSKAFVIALSLGLVSSSALAARPQQAPPASVARAMADPSEGNQLGGSSGWFFVVIIAALLIWGGLELLEDDKPTSP